MLAKALADVVTDVRIGLPAQEILHAAEVDDSDAIIVGRREHNGLAQRLLGSVSERVVRLSPRPVVVVPARPLA